MELNPQSTRIIAIAAVVLLLGTAVWHRLTRPIGTVEIGPPTDQTLMAEFRRHRADYDTLLAMFRQDRGLGRVAYGFTRPANFFSGGELPNTAAVTPKRLARYRRFFDRLSLTGGVEGYDQKRVIYFWRHSDGFGPLGGSGKGFAHSDSLPPSKAAVSGCTSPRRDCWKFRPIGEGWFILEQRSN